MSRLPTLSAREFVAALKRGGYVETRQTGSHLMLQHPTRPMVAVPMHTGDLKRPLMKGILHQAGFTDDQFLALL